MMSQNYSQLETPSVDRPSNMPSPIGTPTANTRYGNKTDTTAASSKKLKKLLNSHGKILQGSKSSMDLNLHQKQLSSYTK